MKNKGSIMKTISVFIFYLVFTIALTAQSSIDNKIFWKENFSSGVLPNDWITKAVNDSGVVWLCTNQPFPGAYGHDQQSPPIASKSGGFHMQVSPAVKVGRNYRRWLRNNVYPDAYFQTNAIDCSDKNSVVLKFKQKFMWNDWVGIREDGGLFVGVSSDGINWKEYDVRNGVASEEASPNPMDVELNITGYAANKETVYLRFFWRGIFAWFWMVDDLELSEALDADVFAMNLNSHPETGNNFTSSEIFKFRIVNLSAYDITESFDCFLKIDNRETMRVGMSFDEDSPFRINDTTDVIFPALDLTDYGIHNIKFFTALPNDNRKSNDTISLQLFSQAYDLGPVTKFEKNGNVFSFYCNNARVDVRFYREDIFRLMMSYNGEFTDPAGDDIVINKLSDNFNLQFDDKSDYYLFSTSQIALRAYKNPLRFALYKSDNITLVWEETKSLSYGKETIQYLKRGGDEYFYGGGMQNGRFSHRGKTIKLNIDYNWEDGGNPNPAPFYMSTKGYGALRNTYAPGEYSFKDTVQLKHEEPRFDCYYFAGESLKNILGDYTDLTGKPFLPPRWALSMGDANCYNRGANPASFNTTGFKGLTPDVIPLIAEKYIEYNMPRGWILPNDGYGCGYTKLDSVITELHKRGFYTGLWTENGVEKIAKEVGEYGSRLCKLDVAWIGYGYKFAIDGCKAAYEGIENNSDARGFIWSVCGWAGTHRNSVVWTGDQSGSWNYIRWHIPTLIGCGLSAQNSATGDVDGIFGGSDSTYTRDLQWKCFTPVFMGMSGWAPKDKQPWIYGEPFTSINRKYLMLKMRLTPYMYTLCNEAYETGVPAVRGLVLEYPADPVALTSETQYEFLLGKNILVAPVYKSEAERDSIYLPAGNWYDFWDGTIYSGNTTLNNYPAPLDKLPLFVKAGSIIPMYRQMFYDAQYPADTLYLDIYPGDDSEFELYEDDGLTREHRNGAYAKTNISSKTGTDKDRIEEVNIGPSIGDYNGKLSARVYVLQINTSKTPKEIRFNKSAIKKMKSLSDYQKSKSGWYFASDENKGIIYIKTDMTPVNILSQFEMKY